MNYTEEDVKKAAGQAMRAGVQAGINQERERILRLLDDEADKGSVNWLMSLINKDAK